MSQGFTKEIGYGNAFVVGETPAGAVDSSNALFTCADGYIGSTIMVWLNGQRKFATDDFTETSPGAGTFTFVTAPTTGASVRVDYMKKNAVAGNADTVDGIHGTSLYPEGGFIGFRAYPTSNQLNIADSTWAKANCDIEVFDIGSNYENTSDYSFTAPFDGYYSFSAQLRWYNCIVNNLHGARIYDNTNDTRLSENSVVVGGTDTVVVLPMSTDAVYLASGTEVFLQGIHTGGAATPDISGGEDNTWLAGHLIAKS